MASFLTACTFGPPGNGLLEQVQTRLEEILTEDPDKAMKLSIATNIDIDTGKATIGTITGGIISAAQRWSSPGLQDQIRQHPNKSNQLQPNLNKSDKINLNPLNPAKSDKIRQNPVKSK